MEELEMEKHRIGADLWYAISSGTTLKIRFALSLMSILTGMQILMGIFGHALPWVERWAMFATLSAPVWSAVLLASGGLMLWRTLSTESRPCLAWFSNVLALVTWFMICVSYVAAAGWRGLVSTYSVVLLMAIFCVLRTEATRRDTETA